MQQRKIKILQISIVGGVAANQFIKKNLAKSLDKKNIDLLTPLKNMTGDNAAMIAWACSKKIFNSKPNIFFNANPRLELK